MGYATRTQLRHTRCDIRLWFGVLPSVRIRTLVSQTIRLWNAATGEQRANGAQERCLHQTV